MTDLMRFEGHEVRILVENGEPLFCASDVCRVLDIGTEQTRRLEDDEKGLRQTQTPGGAQELLHVTESGLYRLVLGSRKPEAKRLQRWVTHEVLPSIRRTGSYAAPETREQLVARALIAATEALAEKDLQIAALQPKAEVYDALVEASGLLCLQAAAKQLDEPPNLWIRWLRQQGHVYDRGGQTYARQDHLDAGRMIQRTVIVDGKQYVQTKVTPRGLVYFAERRPGLRGVRRSVKPLTVALPGRCGEDAA